MPSAPRFQPAPSRIWLALSALNSHLVFFDTNADGAFTKFAVALHLELVEEGPVRHVVVWIELRPDDVAWLEVHEAEGAGADGLQIVRRLARLVALVRLEQMLRDDLPVRPTEGRRPEGRGR